MISKIVDGSLTIADQPTGDELRALAADGFKAVVNFRHAGEPEQPLSPDQEGDRVRAAGLDYLHIPIGGEPIPADGVESLARLVDQHAGQKILLHCRKGGRAAAMALLLIAKREAWTPSEAIAKGQALGLTLDPKLQSMVQTFLSQS
jgi:uncharacterized protein (TIGR01244 family)